MDTKTISLRMDQIFSNFIKKGLLSEGKVNFYHKKGDYVLRVYADGGDLRRFIAKEIEIKDAYLNLEYKNIKINRHSTPMFGNPEIEVQISLKDQITFATSKKELLEVLDLALAVSKPKKVRRVKSRLSIIIINGVKYKKAK